MCVKTKLLQSNGEERIIEPDSEICYCVVKLFRDHSAERKSSTDVAHIKKKIEKLNKEITDRELGKDLIGPNRGCVSMHSGQVYHRPQKRKWTIKSRENHSIDEDIHTELARIHGLFSSAREVSILRFVVTSEMIWICILSFYLAEQTQW